MQLAKEIDAWRAALAQNMAKRNPHASAAELTGVVRRTLLSLWFFRLAEERGLEPRGQLWELCGQPDSYARYTDFAQRRSQTRYQSTLLDCRPGRAWPPFAVDDEVFHWMLRRLCVEHTSAGTLAAWPIETLGSVYQWSLGKTLRLTSERRVRLENQRGARKAGGVYYTPAYIVRHIVEHTLGRQINGRGPAQLAGHACAQPPLRVLDMACGSGWFLLGAYQCLLDTCLQWYVRHQPGRHPDAVCRTHGTGPWRLTLAERMRILTTHLFGVDSDPQAVEVCRLSLLLKAWLEEERETPTGPLAREDLQVLPSLSEHILSGNALIGSDFFAGHRQPDEDEVQRVNPLDWQRAFPDAINAGGFDVILGNPPFINARLALQEHGPEAKRYLACRYQTAQGAYDLYVLFVEKSLELLRRQGRAGMVLPNKIASLDYAARCRALLLTHTSLERITDVSALRVFPGAGVYPYVLIWRKTPPRRGQALQVLHARTAQDLLSPTTTDSIPQRSLSAEAGLAIHGTLDVEARVPTQPLGERAELHSGTTGFSAHQLADALHEKSGRPPGAAFEFVVSRNIERYAIALGHVRFMRRHFERPVLPAARSGLTDNKLRLFRSPKIVVAGMTRRLEAAWDPGGLALGVSVYAVAQMQDNPHYLLGLLNSRLMSHLFHLWFQAKHLAGGFLAINKGQLSRLPIRVIDPHDETDRSAHDRLVSLVEDMLAIEQQLSMASSASRKLACQSRANDADAAIDQLVYGLYRLTPQEIAVVDGTDW